MPKPETTVGAKAHWMMSENQQFGSKPIDLMRTTNGKDQITAYVESETIILHQGQRTLWSKTMDNQQKTADTLRDEVFAATVELFEGDHQAADTWLNEPLRAIGNAVPTAYMGSPERIKTVRDIIGRLEHGVWT